MEWFALLAWDKDTAMESPYIISLALFIVYLQKLLKSQAHCLLRDVAGNNREN
jgi:hypothetical protein